MKFYNEPSRQIPVCDEVDVLVSGSGPAGFAAAIASARQGAKTMLIEQTGTVGGIATAGLMSHWTGDCESKIYREILKRSKEKEEPSNQKAYKNAINPENLKALMLSMLEEAGVKLRLYTFASDVIMDHQKLTGIIIESKSGRQAILAHTIIDATGDGDIAAKAGAEYQKGRETDGKMQPATVMFKVGGVDYSKAIFLGGFEDTFETPNGEIQQLGRQHIPFPAGHVLLYATRLPGIVTCNMTNCIDIDGTNAEDLTRAEIVCRGQIENIIHFLREYAPGYENCYLISSSSLIGIRETRHFKGLYTLTKEDILEARVFEDWVVKDAFFNFDVHNISGSGLDKTGAQKEFQQKRGYTIPYRCLVPEKIDGLLLSGRNISGTHIAHSNFRVMPICVGIGEAAGIAAALCSGSGMEPRQISATEIQKYL